MPKEVKMTPSVLDIVAARFKALGEPARLRILSALRDGEATVSDIIEETGLGQANVSKHLQMLHSLGFVTRRRDGLHIHYGLADREVFRLCDIMCGRVDAQTTVRKKALSGR